MANNSKNLPVIPDCQGCGVCCLHMGYPAFIQPTGDQPGEVLGKITAETQARVGRLHRQL